MASTYLSRTPSSAGDRRKWTWSAWIKLSNFAGAAGSMLFSAYAHSNDNFRIYFSDTYKLGMRFYNGTEYQLNPNRVFRDVNAWYHLVFAVDTTLATSGDRFKIYVNGVRETSFGDESQPTQNLQMTINDTTTMQIGRYSTGTNYFDGSMAHVHLCDGYAYDASDFGETDSTTGIWKPKTAPSVSYGTNGFFLKFENSAAMGTDSSGQGNNLTVNGTMTQLIDTPSNIFNTLNPLAQSGGISFNLSNTNTTLGDNGSTDDDQGLAGTLAVSAGKYYWEVKTVNAGEVIGLKKTDTRIVFSSTDGTPNAGFWGFQSNGSSNSINTYSDGTFNNSNTLQGHANNDIVMFALDMDNGKLFYGRNGSWLGVDNNSADPVNGTNAAFTNIPTDGTFITTWTEHRSSGNPATHWNWGNGYFGTTAVSSAQNPDDGIGIFEYDVPAGYRALCTKSINAEEYS